MPKNIYKIAVLEVLRHNGDKRYVAVIDTFEKVSLLFWSWLNCTDREYYSVKDVYSRGSRSYEYVSENFWTIRRCDEIVPEESVFFDNPQAAEHVAFLEIEKRIEAEEAQKAKSIASVKQITK